MRAHVAAACVVCWASLANDGFVVGQEPPARPTFGAPGPNYVSPEVSSDRKITFRLAAPQAESVRLSSSDLPHVGFGQAMQKTDEGLWEIVVGPIEPGAYRYTFDVAGVAAVDPKNTAVSESNASVASLVYVPGSEAMDLNDVPHGAVAEVTYRSSSLQRFRRMHVYTPPGYGVGDSRYPVLYLLHGAFDCDDSWSSVGRAGFILDNLIAAGKAKPMLVVMPAGHTGPFRFGPPGDNSFARQMDEFADDFLNDVKPFVEKNYRVSTDRQHRALAGLSMGGAQTLDIAIPHLNEFAYLGVFSSGVFGIAGGGFGGQGAGWEERHATALDDPEAKHGLKLIWFATGKEDFLLDTTKATVAVLQKHKFEVTYRETEGGHTWSNWRHYLVEFAPLLFADGQ